MSHHRAKAASLAAAVFATLVLAAAVLAAAGCSQESAAAIYPTADLRPPGLVAAGPSDSRSVLLRFDEAVTPVQGSLSVEPRSDLSARAEDKDLVVSFASDQSPGTDYALAGEVDDLKGNRARFLLRFTGWNDCAPRLRLSEVQTGKNSSKTKPHRDYIELEVLADGNLGGEELSWASSVKSSIYRFPGVEVKKGDFIVLHLAPEGLSEERDELGADLSASGGVDASATGRDFWYAGAPLPDESGAIALALRPGDQPIDGLFYADESKTGSLSDDKLAEMLTSLAAAKAWPLAGAKPAWEDGFRWNSSPAKSICRLDAASGAGAWYATATGAQSPGALNAGPETPAAVQAKTSAKGAAKKVSKRISAKKP
jgi:hypothetical protein